MRLLPSLGLAVLAAAIAGVAYVRLAPSDPTLWHVDPRDGVVGMGAATVGVDAPVLFAQDPGDLLARLDAVAMATPRTVRLAGSVSDGRITYVTRSALIGFPDYTSVAVAPVEGGGAQLFMYARLRFGRSDLGVNAARLAEWRAQLGPTVAGGTALDPAPATRKDGA